METEYKICAHTPLGDESFTITFEHDTSSVLAAKSGSISGDKGTLHFVNARTRDDGQSLVFSIMTEIPFNVLLHFDVMFSNDELIIGGRIKVGEYGYVEFNGNRS